MDFEKEIQRILAAKKGNNEMGIFYDGDGEWLLMLGNRSGFVMLGETPGEIEASGDNLKEVINNMKVKLGLIEDTGEEE